MLLQFDAESKRMYMNTYSPYKDDYNFFNESVDQVTLPLDTKKEELSPYRPVRHQHSMGE
ncbi:hypothetical protein GCM10010911_56440 [Paenibacillus nasutitermitis]|uniref:Uncharacterized protein n=1 Tax=Paenibacillus nasutitermitis TaxID=1652958 RepID=A0A916ZDP8_9BACL|nr:hypothetical protein GCM10010911_56440 [Paenibacillus nasutitermitis]